MITEFDAPRRRRLTERGSALALGLGLLAIPVVPAVANALLPERVWETAAFDEVLTITSPDGMTVSATPPEGWQIQNRGTAAALRDGDAVVMIEVYDLAGRDPRAVTQRLMRSSRVGGVNTTPDGGRISSAEGALSGDTCVAVTTDATGTCAYLTDGEVLVSVISLGGPESPSAPLADIVAPLIREQS